MGLWFMGQNHRSPLLIGWKTYSKVLPKMDLATV